MKQKIKGFTIHEKSGTLYAVKKIAGKVKWLRVGKDLSRAEEIIDSFLTEVRGSHGSEEKACECSSNLPATNGIAERLEKLDAKLESELDGLEKFVNDMVKAKNKRIEELEEKVRRLEGRLEALEKQPSVKPAKKEVSPASKPKNGTLRERLKKVQEDTKILELEVASGVSNAVIYRIIRGSNPTQRNISRLEKALVEMGY